MVRFEQGNAMELPAADDSADAAAMALVIAFVPDPAKGVAEMVRAVKPGGIVAAYMWDWPAGFPYFSSDQVIEARGFRWLPPSSEASAGSGWKSSGRARALRRREPRDRGGADLPRFRCAVGHHPHRPPHGRRRRRDDARRLRDEIRSGLRQRLEAERGKPMTLSARAQCGEGPGAGLIAFGQGAR